MTKTYELPNEKMIMADVDEKHHTATVSVYVLDDLVEAVNKTGHWIGHREHCEDLGVMPSGLGAYEWCSNCDCGIDVKEWHRNNYNYCPNCGARMESEESIKINGD